MSVRTTVQDEAAEVHEYIMKMATADHMFGEYLRQKKPEKVRSKEKSHHGRTGPRSHTSVWAKLD